MIVALFGTLVFAIACAVAVMVLATSLAPAWPRIVALLRDGVDVGAPLPPQPAVALRGTMPRLPRATLAPQDWRAAA